MSSVARKHLQRRPIKSIQLCKQEVSRTSRNDSFYSVSLAPLLPHKSCVSVDFFTSTETQPFARTKPEKIKIITAADRLYERANRDTLSVFLFTLRMLHLPDRRVVESHENVQQTRLSCPRVHVNSWSCTSAASPLKHHIRHGGKTNRGRPALQAFTDSTRLRRRFQTAQR